MTSGDRCFMNIARDAFEELFPEKRSDRELIIRYSAKFRPYNANVRYNGEKMVFSLSKEWKDISDEIKKGLLQSLLVKIFKAKKITLNIDLYDKFVRNLPKYSETEHINPVLKESFDRVNRKYFFSFMETPNLVFGQESFRKLGSYEFMTNTITISTALKDELLLLDYVMYHEMLHKFLKFRSRNGRNYHHTSEFRRRERQFEDSDIEKKLTSFLRKKKLRRAFRFF